MIEVQFLQRASGEEVYLHEPPPGMRIGEDERIITRQVGEQEYVRLSDPSQEHFRAYRFMPAYTGSWFELPDTVNYRLLPLHRHQVLDRGLRIELDAYGQYDGHTYADLVVRELHHYEWYPGRSIPRFREKEIQFLTENGQVGYTKRMPTYFTIDEASKLHQARKEANVGALKETLLQLFIREAGYQEGYARVTAMFSAMFLDVQTYEQAQEGPLLNTVAAFEEEILDRAMSGFEGSPSIREYLLDQLNIDAES